LAATPVISVIDDDESIRIVTCSLVRSLGLRAHPFSSAEEFLQSPLRDETSCVISDVQMPNMNGIELQNILVAQGAPIPIIFFTAFPDELVEAQAMIAGAIAFLCKPFDAQEMISCIDRALKSIGLGLPGN
jgi:FixJ family two-component response regulator